MRWKWRGLGCLTAGLVALVGCWATQPQVRPPERPEEYNLPPPDDPRYFNPPEYPKGTLNQMLLRKDKDGGKDMAPGGFRGGGGSPRFGPGGPGGPGMGY